MYEATAPAADSGRSASSSSRSRLAVMALQPPKNELPVECWAIAWFRGACGASCT